MALAVQIADALEEAHAKGVIHRDLKPSNVMLAAGGRVKVVDFGLAKTAAPLPDSASLSLDPTTIAGMILGTAPYMSPEQVQGKEVDARTDVWAFGCVMYEMLAGRQAFASGSIPEVLAGVLRDEPDWSALPAETPFAVRRLVQRCLRKDAHQRVQHIGDARLELSDLQAGVTSPAVPVVPVLARRRLGRWLIAAVLAAAVVALLVLRPSRLAPAPGLRLSLELPRGLSLQTDYHTPFAIAPGGKRLVLVGAENGVTRLYLRDLDDIAVRPLPGTEGAKQPFFSSDGRSVGFFAERRLKTAPLDGGAPLPLEEVGGNPRGGSWAPDGSIVMAPSRTSGLVRLPRGGGRAVALTSPDEARGEYSHRWPEVLPGGHWVLFTTGLEDASFDEARLDAVSLDTGERRLVLAGASYGRYVPGGFLSFVRAGVLYRIAFDLDRVATRGAAEVLLTGVRYDAGSGEAQVAVSPDGVLVYGPAPPSSPDRYLAWLDRGGGLTRLLDTPRAFRSVRLGPDGKRVAVVVGPAPDDSDLWVLDETAALSRASFGLSPHRPAWASDGKGITVSAQKDGKWRLVTVPADGGRAPEVLLESPERLYPNAWSPDGRHLIFQEKRPETGWDLSVLEVNSAGQPVGAPQPFAATPSQEANAAFSPDGRWVAYESDELDALVQIYVRSFPDGGHKARALASASRPSWGREGELYSWSSTSATVQVAQTREAGGHLIVDEAQPVLHGDGPVAGSLARLVIQVAGARFDVHPSGSRFLFLETAAPALEPTLSAPVVVIDPRLF